MAWKVGFAVVLFVSGWSMSHAGWETGWTGSPERKALVAGRDLWIYRPNNPETSKQTALVFIHGGGWAGGKPELYDPHCRYFAARGYVTISVGYRLTREDGVTVFDCIADVKAAIRTIRSMADELGVKQIVVIGDSAGGHLAACTGVLEGLEGPGQDLSVSSRPDAMILLYPILDTTPPDGWDFRKFSGKAGLAVIERAAEFSPVDHVKPGVPPTLILHGTADELTPIVWSEDFVKRMKEHGNDAVLVSLEGQKHAFITRGYGSEEVILQSLKIMEKYLSSNFQLPPSSP
jgi:acetyl esterase/lipase